MEPTFNVAICGGGNLAHGSVAAIGHFNPHFKISVLSRRPEVWQKQITGYTAKSAWESKGNLVGKIQRASADAKDVVSDADIVIICSPAHTKPEILQQIKPHLKRGCLVGSIFGQGGFDMQAKAILADDIQSKGLVVFCLQYVPFICKVVNYGKDINIIGPKRTLYAAAFPLDRLHYACNAVSQCYHLPCVPIPSFLNLTLCPSNQIIHPGRVTGFFEKFPQKANTVFKLKDVPLLYEGLDDRSADEIQGLDDEIQLIKAAILKKYPSINLDQVMPLKDRVLTMYAGQVSDSSSLKRIFNTNLGYSRVPFPMLPIEGQDLKKLEPGEVKVKLNFNARFFWEDMPYGLCILKDIGNIVGVKTPNIDRNIIFHQQYMPVKYVDPVTGEFIQASLAKTGAPSAMGIHTIEDLVSTSMGQQIGNNIFFKRDAKL